jgi:hypothetical protein
MMLSVSVAISSADASLTASTLGADASDAGPEVRTARNRENLGAFLYDLAERLLDAGFADVDAVVDEVGRFVGGNPPLTDFISAQIDEGWIGDHMRRFVVDGPLHLAVKETSEGLSALTV